MTGLWFEAQEAPPWSLRLYARLPLPPIAIGALLSVIYLLGMSVYFGLAISPDGILPQGVPADDRPFWEIPGWWTLIVNAVMIGFAPTVMVNTLRSVEQDVRDLAPALGLGPQAVEAEIRQVVRLSPTALRGVGCVTAAFMVAFTFLDPGLWSGRERPPLSNPFLVWFLAQQVLLGWLWARAVVADVTTARAFARLAERVQHVDLLDLRPMGVFARRGVRSVLYWMIGLAFFSLFWLAPNPGETNLFAFLLLIGLSGTNLAFLVRGARRRIRDEKEAQLARIRAAIRADQAALLDAGAGAAEAAARLPALFAAETRTASVGELAFDAGTLLRFGLYVTLGVGSWVGGALIERLLGAALD